MVPPDIRELQLAKPREASVADTAELKHQLQALDKALSKIQPGHCNEGDIASITEACKSHRSDGTYVSGSEELFLMLRDLRAPNLIPNVCAGAFKAVLAGRYHVNTDAASDTDTFSTIRHQFLADLDRKCETDLAAKFTQLEDQVHPFPFLRLPTELRLMVYSHLFPEWIRPTDLGAEPDRHFSIMRVNKQVCYEAQKEFFANRTLFLEADINRIDLSLQDICSQFYQLYHLLDSTLAPATLQMVKSVTIMVRKLWPRRQRNEDRILVKHTLILLTQVERIHVDFDSILVDYNEPKSIRCLKETKRRIAMSIPAGVSIKWSSPRATGIISKDTKRRLGSLLQYK